MVNILYKVSFYGYAITHLDSTRPGKTIYNNNTQTPHRLTESDKYGLSSILFKPHTTTSSVENTLIT